MFSVSNCGRPFLTTAPDGFATYKNKKIFKSVSPDHIVYRVRTVKNDPYADFGFWREALPERMRNAGYRVIGDTVMSIENNRALFLEMAAPMGETDYSYLVMMIVKKKKILIAESAGMYTDFQKRKESVIDALKKTAFR
jgi:hypothetical protein